jgi:hypothetical protein
MYNDEEKKVINFDLMKHFYCLDYENDKDVRETWYIYVLKFLPLVSTKWKGLVSNNNLQKSTSMFTAITISDEALVRWFIILWIKNINDIKEKKLQKVKNQKVKVPMILKLTLNYTQYYIMKSRNIEKTTIQLFVGIKFFGMR